MKIAFVNDYAQQLGMQYITSLLETEGHQIKLFMDPQLFDDDIISVKKLNRIFDYKKKLITDLKSFQPDLVGISVVTDFYQWACSIARMVKQEMDVPIIFGGIHPTSVPERVIKNDFVDMVCVGEGEYPMLELANSMERGQIDYSIKNIWFKRNGSIIRNEVRPLIEDLDSLPMPNTDIYFSTFPHFRKTGMYLISTSRGCPHSCSYCCHSYLHELYRGKGKYVRQRSIQNVISEIIKSKEKYGIKFITFMDNCFGYDVNWLKEFSLEYSKKVRVKFGCVMHPNHVSDESIKYLKLAGCYAINIGIQSWSERVRMQILERNVNDIAMKRAIELIKKEKIRLMTDSIFDLPDQKEEDIIASAFQYADIKPKRIYYYMLRYYPNTVITKKAKQTGWLTAQRYEEIMDGINVTSFAIGGDKVNKNSIKFQILFYVIDLIPKRISYYIIKKRIYRFFPAIFGPAIIVILRNLFAFDMNARLLRAGAFYRYGYFIKSKFLNFRNNTK